MEFIECKHREKIEYLGQGGVQRGICSVCGQTVQYYTKDEKLAPQVTLLGRIEGKIVLPSPAHRFLLPPQDKKDLEEAKLQLTQSTMTEPVAESAPHTSIYHSQKEQLKWYHTNKRAMIEDLIKVDRGELPKDEFLMKWNIKRQMISHLKADSHYHKLAGKPEKSKQTPKKRDKGDSPALRVAYQDRPSSLPNFPQFSDSWPVDVQVKWLEVYLELTKLGTPK